MRELSDESVKDQAEAFIDYVSRGGTPTAWWASKAFADEDREEIVSEAAKVRGRVYI